MTSGFNIQTHLSNPLLKYALYEIVFSAMKSL